MSFSFEKVGYTFKNLFPVHIQWKQVTGIFQP